MLFKAMIVGFLIALGEILNGNIRVRILHRRFGKKRAKEISFVSGSLIIFLICLLTLHWINPGNYRDCILIGCIWLSIMLCLDIYFGRFVFKLKWVDVFNDFNPVKGNLLGVGMVFLFFCPTIVFMFTK